jgi:G patch domain/KOW motif-containing protein
MSMSDVPGAAEVGGKRLGFQFKGTAKRQKIVESEQLPTVDIITGIEGADIKSVKPQSASDELVIPLIQPRNASTPAPPSKHAASIPAVKELKQATSREPNLDQLAAAELLAESKGGDKDSDDQYGSLVIKQEQKPDEGKTDGPRKKAPLLMLNVAPELLNIANENDRFKYDVSSRAEDLSVRSEIYEAIPVSQFGAALLRGMGWGGPDKDESKSKGSEKLVAREQRLGLGAQAKPPDKPKHHKPSSTGPSTGAAAEAAARGEKARRSWEQRAEQKLRDQKLFDGDYVWLRAPAELSGKRALVVAAKGVPGLDRVRVQLEHSGRVLETGRRDCVLLSPTDLQDKPFVEAADAAQLREEQVRSQAQGQYKGMGGDANKAGEGSNSSTNGGGGQEKSKDNETRVAKVKQESSGRSSIADGRVKSEGNGHSSGSHNSKGTADAAQQRAPVYWLREGIRVKVVSKSVGGQRAYLQKGTVLDVYARGRASVRLDDGTVLDEVGERHVESIVPAVGGSCVVLLGPHRGQAAVLMQRLADMQRVVVQLGEDLEVVELDMDDVAATGR